MDINRLTLPPCPCNVIAHSVRGQALALATFVNFGSNFLVSLALPTVQEAVGMSATYFGFAAIGALALTSIYLTVPET